MTQGLTASGIVSAWQVGLGRRPLDRAIALLWSAGLAGDIASLPLEDRDRHLLALRQATFGGTLSAVTRCPQCELELELDLETAALAEALVLPAAETLEEDDRAIALRPLNSRDLAAAAALPESDVPGLLRQRLTGQDQDLPARLRTRVDRLIEERAAASEINIALTCADCAANWSESLDVAAHVWAEIETAAHRIMAEVAEIATAFGWSEKDILTMHSARRRAYLNLARGG